MPSEARLQLLGLDAVRGLAAVTVLLGHVRGSTWVEFGALPPAEHTPLVAAFFGATRLGGEAVLIFFVLSGFLVGGGVIARVRARTFSPTAYALDRATRILLPLIPAALLTAGLNAYVFHTPNGIVQVFANMVGLNGVVAATLNHNAPLWSLSFEVWFYVGAGAAGCIALRRTPLIAMTVLGGAVAVLSRLGGPYFLFWALGALTTLIVARKGRHLAILGIPLALGGIIAIQLSTDSMSFHAIPLNKHVGEALLAGGFCLCLPALATASVDRALAFALAPIRFLSAVSYSVYLFHYPINSALDLVFRTSPALSTQSFAVFTFRLLSCGLGCGLCWFMFERQTDRLRRYLRRHAAHATVVVAVPEEV
jgi:peptidoglycan/LPS O-acetylase OafA/YrhL